MVEPKPDAREFDTYRVAVVRGEFFVIGMRNDAPMWWRVVAKFFDRDRAEDYADTAHFLVEEKLGPKFVDEAESPPVVVPVGEPENEPGEPQESYETKEDVEVVGEGVKPHIANAPAIPDVKRDKFCCRAACGMTDAELAGAFDITENQAAELRVMHAERIAEIRMTHPEIVEGVESEASDPTISEVKPTCEQCGKQRQKHSAKLCLECYRGNAAKKPTNSILSLEDREALLQRAAKGDDNDALAKRFGITRRQATKYKNNYQDRINEIRAEIAADGEASERRRHSEKREEREADAAKVGATKSKWRKCLKCQHPFKSAGSHNAVCPTCKNSPAWRGGQDATIHAAQVRGV